MSPAAKKGPNLTENTSPVLQLRDMLDEKEMTIDMKSEAMKSLGDTFSPCRMSTLRT